MEFGCHGEKRCEFLVSLIDLSALLFHRVNVSKLAQHILSQRFTLKDSLAVPIPIKSCDSSRVGHGFRNLRLSKMAFSFSPT